MVQIDTSTVIQRMQDAVNVVLSSEHEANKVAACAFHPGHTGFYASPNLRPDALKACFPWQDRIGASSQFIHAELAALTGFDGPLEGAHLCVTDPFCPNCAKNIAEAGVRAIYIDHKGFEKDFIARNGDEFRAMSMLVAEKAGISVYRVNRKEGIVEPIKEQAMTTYPSVSAIEFFDVTSDMSIESALASCRMRLGARETWALAFARDSDNNRHGLLVFEALPPGITPDDFKMRDENIDKYRFPIDPVTRLLIALRRLSLRLESPEIGCARIPSSRALVNAVGLGVLHIKLASDLSDHDPRASEALKLLSEKNILRVTEVP